jgi:predicted anti-sigma-YlaC factor YlaD
MNSTQLIARPDAGDAATRCRVQRHFAVLVLAVLALSISGCSVKRYAINQLGNALANSGTTFAGDDDPELVRGAVPFSLKLVESLLAESPNHPGLLLAAASGFTQYGVAFVEQDADEAEEKDLAAATALRQRARKLYRRARDYGLRGLEVAHPGISKALRASPKSAVAQLGKSDIRLVYWTAASWGALIGVSKDNPEILADQTIVEALIDRALTLDESFGDGAVHQLLIRYELVRQGASGDPVERARKHYQRSLELARGSLAGPFVTWAENVSVQKQDAAEFKKLLAQALAVNVDAKPEARLENLIMQRRAKWLVSRADDLILPAAPPPEKPATSAPEK